MKKKLFISSFSTILLFCIYLLFFFSCNNINDKKNNTLFQLINADSSGIYFANNISTNDSLNIFTYEYLYNGGGVGVGDFNNDGLQDIFFTGNMVPSKLYLNKGNFKFEDITESAGINVQGWPFGVSVADINGDGLQDIYVCMGGPGNKDIYPNKLFINQGIDKNNQPHFKEMSAEYGLADSSQSIQAAFFDYDHDGDLDMYLLVGGGFEKSPIIPHPIVKDGSARNTDRLYRNDFDKNLGHPVFKNVSKQANILEEGFGLGVSLLDINDDGWLDVYVTNDYLTNDLLYINNRDGTYSEQAAKYFKHTSHFAMGNDVGDINNDGLTDLMAVDMLPDDRYNRMLMFGPNQYDKFYYAIGQGYNYQYMRNTLQLNMGSGKFSEIGQLSNVYKTSWSWSVLFADLDNDEFQDIFITNGFGKNITDLDFVKYRSNLVSAANVTEQTKILIDSLSDRPPIKTHCYAYKNNHDYTFKEVSKEWGFNTPAFSNGAAYADLDNDGDLDIITNNINEPARIYRNTLHETSAKGTANYLDIKLKGNLQNTAATGSKITIKYEGKIQTRLQTQVRGFESTVENIAHFGLGTHTIIDTIQIVWPDGKQTLQTNIKANQVLFINYSDNNFTPDKKDLPPPAQQLFTEISSSALHIQYFNKPHNFNDFNYERLLPKKYSQNGQGIAVGDVNGDGLEDFFVGGAYQQPGQIYIQKKDGTFNGHPLSKYNDGCSDAGTLLFDADNDGDADLYIVSGGDEFTAKNSRYQGRLYKNDGKGNFTRDSSALPVMLSSGSGVVAADYDQDGDLDLFVAGRVVPGAYPQTPDSYLLRNDGGKFTDVTDMVAPGLRKAGMISCALWADIDNDAKPDLILAGEWMPVTIFKNNGHQLTNITAGAGLQGTEGWWQSLVAGDFDNDGDIDFIAGNWGLNNPYHVTKDQPMSICFNDFDHNGSTDAIINCYQNGINFPVSPWDYVIEQVPSLRKKLPTYAAYAAYTTDKLLSKLDTAGMHTLYCKTMQSAFIENKGNGNFTIKNLPIQAQVAPIFGMIAEDINHDGNLDFLAAGNFFATDVVIGKYDALKGLTMLGDGKGNFKPVVLKQSGFIADGDAKGMARIEAKNNSSLILITQNADSLKIFKDNTAQKLTRIYPQKNEAYAMLHFTNGAIRKSEISYGSTYLSQSSAAIIVTKDINKIELFNYKGMLNRTLHF